MLTHIFQNGINLGGWLSQYELLAAQPLSEGNLVSHFNFFITESDIQQIAEWGFDHVRLPVSGYLLYDPVARRLNKLPIIYIEKCIEWCQTYHLNMILDLHDLRGNVYGAMDTPMPLLMESCLQDDFFNIWSEMTKYFKGRNDIVIAFELLNEVSDASHYLWNRLYKSAVKKIRNINMTRLILTRINRKRFVFPPVF